jgi:hypothetical protein
VGPDPSDPHLVKSMWVLGLGPAFSLLKRGSCMLGPAESFFNVGPTTSDLRVCQACVGAGVLTYALVKLAWVRDTGPAVRDANAGLT